MCRALFYGEGKWGISWSMVQAFPPTGMKISIPAWDAILPPTAWKLKSSPPLPKNNYFTNWHNLHIFKVNHYACFLDRKSAAP